MQKGTPSDVLAFHLFAGTGMGATFGFVVHTGSGVPVRGGAPKVGQEHVAMQIYTDWSKKLFDPKLLG